ncbi:heat shock factor binding protein 1-domain-containing protein [Cladochytrium replicatum]|nr:heat shock factor binding protein 1-domain-containing protein [Cladochytrium replicatum]
MLNNPAEQSVKHTLKQGELTGDSTMDVQSPQELSVFVETVLKQLQSKFEDVSTQIISKLDEMGSRVDDLEKTIGDLLTQSTTLNAQGNNSTSKDDPQMIRE